MHRFRNRDARTIRKLVKAFAALDRDVSVVHPAPRRGTRASLARP